MSPGDPLKPVAWTNDDHRIYVGAEMETDKDPAGGIRIMVSSTNGENTVITVKNRLWLWKAEIIGAFQADKYVYFVFKEKPFFTSTQREFSRIARVCADDAGTVLGNDNTTKYWSSFTKATLECGEYNVIQAIAYEDRTNMLYATFAAEERRNPGRGSAICHFKHESIDAAFQGDFLCRKGANWEPCKPSPPDDTVETCFGPRNLKEVTTQILRENTIKSECGGPLYETPMNLKWIGVGDFGGDGPLAYVSVDGNILALGPLVCSEVQPLEHWEISPVNRTINYMTVKDTVLVLTNREVISIPPLTSIPTATTGTTTMTTTEMPKTAKPWTNTLSTTPRTNQAHMHHSCSMTKVLTVTAILNLA